VAPDRDVQCVPKERLARRRTDTWQPDFLGALELGMKRAENSGGVPTPDPSVTLLQPLVNGGELHHDSNGVRTQVQSTIASATRRLFRLRPDKDPAQARPSSQ
jgi:hypothetical protein